MSAHVPPESACYEALAEAYDLSGQGRFGLRMLTYVLELLALARWRPSSWADLACGTGGVTVALARRRFSVVGVDGSAAMLERAQARAERWRVAPLWLQQDLTELALTTPVQMATCFYDSLNHLTDPLRLAQAFMAVRRNLQAGGVFCFDMLTPTAFTGPWAHHEDSHLGEAHARFWRARHDPARGINTLEATYFLAEADGRYRRVAAQHEARGYDQGAVAQALAAAGFELAHSYGCFSLEPPAQDEHRILYWAKA